MVANKYEALANDNLYRKIEVLVKKPWPIPLCSLKIPHGLVPE
jgi:hypothetical protein